MNFSPFSCPVFLDWIRAKAPFEPGILCLEDEETGKEGAFDDSYWM
jgi:hypothetical protein